MFWVLKEKCLLVLELRTFPWENKKPFSKMNEVLHNLQNPSECVCGSEREEGEWRLNPITVLFKNLFLFFIAAVTFMCACFFPTRFEKNTSILKA